MKEYTCVRRNVVPRQIFTATIIFALLSTLFFFSPVQLRTLAQTANESDIFLNNSPAVSPNIVISQVYGGGGNSGAPFTNDYIELFNRGTAAVNITGWSVQYASAAGTGNFSNNITNLSGSIEPGKYYLIQQAGGATGIGLPTADATGTINIGAAGGKVVLVNSTTGLTCNGGTTTCSSAQLASIVDLIGFGSANFFEGTAPAPAPSNTTADLRAANGCTDTDQNSTDFATGAPAPRNSSSPANSCSGTGVTTISINNVSVLEGNSGTTTATFTINLSSAAGTGGVTFDIATQDNTATVADNDYAAKSLTGQTIAAGNSSYTFDVTVNGDTNVEPNETFFVNVTNVVGASPTGVQGTGTIINDETTQINQIQGGGSSSPLVGQAVTTGGIVTAAKSNGFFLQTPDANVDANSNTSEGIFVFTSSAPPSAAAIGNFVNVSGTVAEFVPSTAPNQPPLTEIVSPTVTFVSSNNPLPVPVTITAGDTTPNNLENLERLEGMRVRVDSLTVVAPTQGNITESSAAVNSNGLFYGVVTGVPRPFREPGIDLSINPPAGAPANVPRFDTNPERLRIDSDTQPGAPKLNVAVGEIVSNIVGPLDYAFVTWSIYPDAATPPTVSNIKSAIPVPLANVDEFTIASFNMQRFFDTVDDPGTSDPILTQAAFNGRLNKASLAIRNVMRSPDVIGVEEMENLSTLQAVAAKVNDDAVTAGQSNPNYQAYLVEGNDVGGIDVGFLVKSSRVTVIDVNQVGKNATYINPNTNAADLLNDRPPLILRASIQPAAGAPVQFTVIVNHLRSLSGIDDPVNGNRIRTKRQKQAEYLAELIQARQIADPNERIISIGDYNAFQFNDGYVDSIGTIKGDPTPADQVVLASGDLVNPNLTDLLDFLPPTERYSFTFDGNAQVLDHELVNDKMLEIFNRIAYARNNADFPQIYYQDSTRPERISDHDAAVAYFSLNGTGISNQGIEGDVASRPNGDGEIQANDVVQMIRFFNELDTPNTSTNEFQRADSAPRSTRGDGIIDSTDIVQTIRYLNELDAPQSAGGPIAPSSNRAEIDDNETLNFIDNFAADKFISNLSKQSVGKLAFPQVAPELRVESASGGAGNQVTLNIRVDALGTESQYGFAVLFDPAVLTFANFAAGDTGAATFSCNTTATAGRVRCNVGAFPNNRTGSNPVIGEINAGNNQLLIKVIFNIAANAAVNSTTAVTLASVSASDENAASITPAATGGTVTIMAPTAAGATISGRVTTAGGRGIGGAGIKLTNAEGNTRTAVTTAFGYYRFEDVAAGQTYVVSVKAKRYTFSQATQILNVNADDDNVNFVAQTK